MPKRTFNIRRGYSAKRSKLTITNRVQTPSSSSSDDSSTEFDDDHQHSNSSDLHSDFKDPLDLESIHSSRCYSHDSSQDCDGSDEFESSESSDDSQSSSSSHSESVNDSEGNFATYTTLSEAL